MPASGGADHYLPPRLPTLMVNDTHQTSEEPSSIPSPEYEGSSFMRHDQFRYPDQHDIRIPTGGDVLVTEFSDYSSSLISPEEAPLIDTTLQVPRSNAFQPHQYALLPRNHQDQLPPAQPSPTSRTSHDLGEDLFNYGRQAILPLPGGPTESQPHDPTHTTRLNAPTMVTSIPVENPPSVPSSEPLMGSSAIQPNPSRRDRKEVSPVVIACRQCRGRKIRCDSTRPVCNNCVRRSNTCEYDTVPKRRGPDKRPGTRQRSCKKRPTGDSANLAPNEPPAKRRKTDHTPGSTQVPPTSKENMAAHGLVKRRSQEGVQTTELRIDTEQLPLKEAQSPITHRYIPYGNGGSLSKSAFPRPIDTNVAHVSSQRSHSKYTILNSPVTESLHKDWWNEFLVTSGYSLNDLEVHTRYLFSDTLHSLEFLNVEYFVQTLHNPDRRHTIQPSLILAVLALSTLMKSSSIEDGDTGRKRALYFRDAAHQAVHTAIASDWVDAAVAGASLVLCLFESSAHPLYDPARHMGALDLLSGLIRSLTLTTIDSNDPDVCRFAQNAVPCVQLLPSQALSQRCICIPSDAQQPPDSYSTWSYPLPWDPSWSDIQIKDEECRRLVWCALGMAAQHTVQSAALHDQNNMEGSEEGEELWICNPSNYAILFPAEVIDRASPAYRGVDSPSPKESVYALYCRSMLLWVFCHYRLRTCPSEELKAEYAQEAMGESQFIQESLDFHTCNLDTGLIYLTREYISK
ncbi:hypothetical protein AAF712_007649 [Marasmius tenuissimus]|uniref:Zn(2)-C6 fungal-type domain-containing protein n=1 Tax=Marasmius tenuissimus TaxID=585030 RepID=A0ABR2ZVI9_9AGAR